MSVAVESPELAADPSVVPAEAPVAEAPGEEQKSPLNADVLEKSFALLAPQAEELVSRFYFRLFRAAPQTYRMFPQNRFAEQKKMLLAALKMTVNNVRKPEALIPVLQDLGVKHKAYGAGTAEYALVGSILLATMAEFAGDAWTPEIEAAWTDAYGVIQSVMLEAAQAA